MNNYDNSEMGKVPPTKAELHHCSIGGKNYQEIENNVVRNNFHVQELRIYEDNCKFYFTGQLVIEAHQNIFERFLAPQAIVEISFKAPPNSRIYTERFRVYSYESKPREGDLNHSSVITISLIGDEYYLDKSKQVQRNFKLVTATQAARDIHQLIAANGRLDIPLESKGPIGLENHPHQVLSKQPSKAIHDLLDKAIFPVPHFGPGIYFRNKDGYVIAPLEWLLFNAPNTGHFIHTPAGGFNLNFTLEGYQQVIHFRPMAPPGEDRGGARAQEFMSGKVAGFIDFAEGNSLTGKGSGGGGYLAGVIKNATDSYRQPQILDKQGPGGYQAAEDAFISQLTYSPKYWVSVPLQSGIDVTVGDRIDVTYPVVDEVHRKTLWVARLIHELRFTEGRDRREVSVNGTTDIFGVYYTG